MFTKFRISNPDSQYKDRSIQVYDTITLDYKARIAASLLERWGPVLAATDGESSDGRQKIRALTPEEIAQKACNIAEATMAEFEHRGWLINIPDMAEINKEKIPASTNR